LTSQPADDLAAQCFPAPSAAFFDRSQNSWVLSRYQDVLDAMHEPALRQEGHEKVPAQVRQNVSDAISQSRMSEWEKQIEPLAHRIIAALPQGRSIELVSEVLRPWSCAVTSVVLGLDASGARQLAALAPHLSHGNARSLHRIGLAIRRRVASARLKRLLRGVRLPGVQSLFLGISQTLPEFLAKAWLALLENPSQLARLQAEPNLMPKGVDELLRFSGPVHTLVRRAERDVEIADLNIAEGDRVILKVALANRDPGHFINPNSLDIARRNTGHLSLGGGPHSCVGALLVRMAAISATRAFTEKMAMAELVEPVVWRRGSTLESPHSLRVRLES
jgi:cytochrome P450